MSTLPNTSLLFYYASLVILLTTTAGCDGSGSVSETVSVDSASVAIAPIQSPQKAGQPFDVSLTVEDTAGNPVTRYSGTLDLTVSKGSSITPTSTTFTSSDNGTKEISVTLTGAATGEKITLTDASENTIKGTSNTFNVDVNSAASGWHRQALRMDDANREFKYYVPSNLPSDAPAVMALHGATIGMDQMFAESRQGSQEWIEIAEEDGVLIVVPNASHDTNPVWNDCTPLPDRGTPDDARFLVALTDWALNRTPVAPDSVFIYGISNGGQMANRLAVEHPDHYAGIAAFISNINANLGEDAECSKPSVPIKALVVSGKNDQTTPFDGGFAPDWGTNLLSAPATRDFWVDNNVQGPPPIRQVNETTDDNSRVSCEITLAPQTGADVQLCAFEGSHTVPADIFESTRVTWQFFRDR